MIAAFAVLLHGLPPIGLYMGGAALLAFGMVGAFALARRRFGRPGLALVAAASAALLLWGQQEVDGTRDGAQIVLGVILSLAVVVEVCGFLELVPLLAVGAVVGAFAFLAGPTAIWVALAVLVVHVVRRPRAARPRALGKTPGRGPESVAEPPVPE